MVKIVLKVLLVLGIFVIPYLLFKWSFYRNADRVRLDGKRGEVLAMLLISDTKYSSGYSHEKFQRISLGMSEADVIGILGEPLKKWTPYLYTNFPLKKNYVGFEYSTSPSSGSYRLRQINFNQGKVVEVIYYFYVD